MAVALWLASSTYNWEGPRFKYILELLDVLHVDVYCSDHMPDTVHVIIPVFKTLGFCLVTVHDLGIYRMDSTC